MVGRSLASIEKDLNNLYEQLDAVKSEIAIAQDEYRRKQYEQRIRDRIKPGIQELESEYLQILSQNADNLNETEAETVIEVVSAEIERVQAQPDTYPQAILDCLQRIETKLNQPGTSAAAKLKGTLSMMPPFVNLSYEGELDTENFFRKNFPTFRKLLPGLKK